MMDSTENKLLWFTVVMLAVTNVLAVATILRLFWPPL